MEFSPFNPVVKMCLLGMASEANGQPAEATRHFLQAWQAATNHFEHFLAAHYLARMQETVPDRLSWLEKGLQHALQANSPAANSALGSLYVNLARCYESLGYPEKAKAATELAQAHRQNPSDEGPFYHGTRANLQPGDLLVPGAIPITRPT